MQGYHDLRVQIILQYLNNLGINTKGAVQFPRLHRKRTCADPALKHSPATRYICFLGLQRPFFSCSDHPLQDDYNKTKTLHQHNSSKAAMKISAFSCFYKASTHTFLLTLKTNSICMCNNLKKKSFSLNITTKLVTSCIVHTMIPLSFYLVHLGKNNSK